MEDRKIAEIAHYDDEAKKFNEDTRKTLDDNIDVSGIEIGMMESYKYVYNILQSKVSQKKVLDYGCGHGMHSVKLAEWAGEVSGIDLSEESLKIARDRAAKKNLIINFIAGDCEALPFTDNTFDIVFDGGTFSSLDFVKATDEIKRVLKPDGLLIGIETLGHNPLLNLKRSINKLRGIRTGWAADHIMKNFNFHHLNHTLTKVDQKYFELFSMFIFPFRSLRNAKKLFSFVDKIDTYILKLPIIKYLAFKTVFVYKK